MLEIQPGKFLTKGGQYALILSQKTMGGGKNKYWHGQVLAALTSRRGMQNAWDLWGQDMGGNRELDLVAPAYVEHTDLAQ
jgi:hypothetical protein